MDDPADSLGVGAWVCFPYVLINKRPYRLIFAKQSTYPPQSEQCLSDYKDARSNGDSIGLVRNAKRRAFKYSISGTEVE